MQVFLKMIKWKSFQMELMEIGLENIIRLMHAITLDYQKMKC